VQEYEIANRHGSKIDICVHAGLVAAAYLQAKDESNYQRWKSVERKIAPRLECRPNRRLLVLADLDRISRGAAQAKLLRIAFDARFTSTAPRQRPLQLASLEGYLCPCLLPLLPSLGCEAEACRESR
jgi:hypothetical protein